MRNGRRLRNTGPVRLMGCFAAANARLTVLVVVSGVCSGALFPLFVLATGALVGAVRGGRSLWWPLTAVVAAFLAQRVLDPVLEEAGQALWRQVDESLSQRMMRAVVHPPGLAPVESPTVRDRLVQARGELTDLTPGQAGYHLGRVIALVTQGAGSLLILATYRWWMGLALLAGYAVTFTVYGRHWRHVTLVIYGRTDRLRHAHYLRSLALEPAAAKETRVFGLADWLVDGYRRRWMTEMAGVWRTRREGWAASVAVITGLAVLEGVAVINVVQSALDGHLSIGRAVVLVQAVLGAAALGQYTEGHWLLSECSRAIERIEEVEVEAAGAADPAAGWVAADGLPAAGIRLSDLRFTYPGATEPVVNGLDLDIEAGSSLAIVGENGAGKTTLVKLLCGLYQPDSGAITVDGTDLRDIDPSSWRRRIAAVFQDFVQFELSAYDNVAYGALHNRDDHAGVAEAAALAGATQVIDRLPGGWSTPLSRQFSDGTQLSGGEWQRLALSRALFAVRSGAGVLILDEPTAALDVRGEAEVYERFLELTRGATTIVISHRFSTVRRADRIVVIEGGRVVEDGHHEQLLAAGGRYAQMYWLQAKRFDVGDDPHA